MPLSSTAGWIAGLWLGATGTQEIGGDTSRSSMRLSEAQFELTTGSESDAVLMHASVDLQARSNNALCQSRAVDSSFGGRRCDPSEVKQVFASVQGEVFSFGMGKRELFAVSWLEERDDPTLYERYFSPFLRAQAVAEIHAKFQTVDIGVQLTDDVTDGDRGSFNGARKQPAPIVRITSAYRAGSLALSAARYDINHSFFGAIEWEGRWPVNLAARYLRDQRQTRFGRAKTAERFDSLGVRSSMHVVKGVEVRPQIAVLHRSSSYTCTEELGVQCIDARSAVGWEGDFRVVYHLRDELRESGMALEWFARKRLSVQSVDPAQARCDSSCSPRSEFGLHWRISIL